MSEQHDEHIKALIEQHTAQRRRESDREAAVKPLPADVPLHKRGFGVMEEPPA